MSRLCLLWRSARTLLQNSDDTTRVADNSYDLLLAVSNNVANLFICQIASQLYFYELSIFEYSKTRFFSQSVMKPHPVHCSLLCVLLLCQWQDVLSLRPSVNETHSQKHFLLWRQGVVGLVSSWPRSVDYRSKGCMLEQVKSCGSVSCHCHQTT